MIEVLIYAVGAVVTTFWYYWVVCRDSSLGNHAGFMQVLSLCAVWLVLVFLFARYYYCVFYRTICKGER